MCPTDSGNFCSGQQRVKVRVRRESRRDDDLLPLLRISPGTETYEGGIEFESPKGNGMADVTVVFSVPPSR